MDALAGNPISIEIVYRAEDFVSASRWLTVRRPVNYVSCGLIAGGFALIGMVSLGEGVMYLAVGLMLGGTFGGLLGFILLLLKAGAHARKSFRSTPAFGHPMHWQLTSRDLNIQGKGVSATLELNNIVRVVETPTAFLLWQSATAYNYLPKHAIPDRSTLERVRAYLRDGLSSTAKIQLRDD